MTSLNDEDKDYYKRRVMILEREKFHLERAVFEIAEILQGAASDNELNMESSTLLDILQYIKRIAKEYVQRCNVEQPDRNNVEQAVREVQIKGEPMTLDFVTKESNSHQMETYQSDEMVIPRSNETETHSGSNQAQSQEKETTTSQNVLRLTKLEKASTSFSGGDYLVQAANDDIDDYNEEDESEKPDIKMTIKTLPNDEVTDGTEGCVQTFAVDYDRCNDEEHLDFKMTMENLANNQVITGGKETIQMLATENDRSVENEMPPMKIDPGKLLSVKQLRKQKGKCDPDQIIEDDAGWLYCGCGVKVKSKKKLKLHLERTATTAMKKQRLQEISVTKVADSPKSSGKTAPKEDIDVSSIDDRLVGNSALDQPNSTTEEKHLTKMNGLYKCDICEYTTLRKFNYHRHMEKHSSETRYLCCICGKNFKSQKGLDLHSLQHEGTFKFMCNFCGKGYNVESALKIHENMHASVKSYQCKRCGLKYAHMKDLCYHINSIHRNIRYEFPCEICNKTFKKKTILNDHMKSIHIGRLYSCCFCNKQFKHRSSLAYHRRKCNQVKSDLLSHLSTKCSR